MLQCGNVDPTGILWATLYISGTFFISVKKFLIISRHWHDILTCGWWTEQTRPGTLFPSCDKWVLVDILSSGTFLSVLRLVTFHTLYLGCSVLTVLITATFSTFCHLPSFVRTGHYCFKVLGYLSVTFVFYVLLLKCCKMFIMDSIE